MREEMPLLAGIIALAIAFRLCILAALVHFNGYDSLLLGDSVHYLRLAEHMRDGIGYVYEGVTETYRAPGYPAFLYVFVVTGVPLIAASLVQIIMSSLIPPGAYLLMRRLSVPRAWSIGAALFLAIEPVLAFYSVVLMPDVFFSILTLVAAWCAVRWCEEGAVKWAVSAGLSCGVANYLRPADLYLPIAFFLGGLMVLAVRRTITPRAVFVLAMVPFFSFLVMAPWSLRNLYLFNTTEFVSAKASNLYKYGAGATLATAEHRDLNLVIHDLNAKAEAEAPNPHLNTFEDEDYLLRESKKIIFAHPFDYLKTYLLGLNGFWFSGNYHSLLASYGMISAEHRSVSYSLIFAQEGISGLVHAVLQTLDVYVLIALFGKALWFVLTAFALGGFWILRRRPEVWVSALLSAYFSATLLSTTIGVEARHRFALIPLVSVFAFAAMATVYRHFTRAKRVL